MTRALSTALALVMRRPGRVRPPSVLLIGSLVLALGGEAQAVCPPEFLFGCTVSGSAAGSGLLVQNGTGTGVTGASDSASGVHGISNSDHGVKGSSASGSGVAGFSDRSNGTFGQSTSGHGVFGVSIESGYGVYGLSSFNAAVRGEGVGHVGVLGTSHGGEGVQGTSVLRPGVSGTSTRDEGVYGLSTGGGVGVFGESLQNDGVAGTAYSVGKAGVSGFHSGDGTGVWGESTSGYAGYFHGDVRVVGNLQKPAGQFIIDHPLDPTNKTLSHSFVESPDMMNIYNGNTVTDAHGDVTITLPAYFQALNRDFRYQLTVIEQFAQAMVLREIEKNQFTIKTDKPHVKVSWMVTGVRQDAYAKMHRITVEGEKPAQERGTYLHPEVYGQPKEKGVIRHSGQERRGR
jgi:hypothetical protein